MSCRPQAADQPDASGDGIRALGPLKTYRIHRNLDQATLSKHARVSVRALRNLESGNGSTLRTLIQMLRALGQESWLYTIVPVPTPSLDSAPANLEAGNQHER
ncbi:helix-turn-helix domain-containing protein [Cupriavidus necator]